MADVSFLAYRDLDGPVAPEGREDFDPRAARRRWLREGEPREDGEYVLYWMQMFRRTRSNAALDEAVRMANRLERPLVVYEGLARYAEASSDPGAGVTSDLSPYLHFGCLSSREAALRALDVDAPAEAVDAWLEQLVVRRELAYNFCWFTPLGDHASLDVLPDWARGTMAAHADDERPKLYDRAAFEEAATDDDLWNAAQRELLHTGTIHSYMRMLWGKKVLEWSEDYGTALETMVDLHHRYALDGRNPATYTNILWCFGLHDRAFGERPVFGKLRPMTCASTRRKHDVDSYMQRVDAWQERVEQRLERD